MLYLGALGDRYGRKLMLVLGTLLAIPAALIAALAPSIEVLFFARVFGGVAAGMAFATTLALIAALWSGPPRTKAIALWSALGGAIAALGPLISGALLTHFDWGSVFVITLPLAVVALVMAIAFVRSHVNESTDPVDNLSGIFSMVLVGALVLAINFAAVPNDGALAIGLGAIALAAAIVFLIRQRQAESPLYDLRIARRRIFWVAACAGLVVFGTLMAAMFVGQQFQYAMSSFFAGTPASHSLTGSVPVSRAGMASGTADLQRDLGGAIMQSILGALLTAGYAAAVATAIAADPNKEQITDSVQAQLQKSFAGAEEIAEQYPQYAGAITAGAKTSFLDGADWAYTAGIVAILLGATLVFVLFPKKDEEEALLDEYRAEDVKITSPG